MAAGMLRNCLQQPWSRVAGSKWWSQSHLPTAVVFCYNVEQTNSKRAKAAISQVYIYIYVLCNAWVEQQYYLLTAMPFRAAANTHAGKGTIKGCDFANSLVTAADIRIVDAYLDKVCVNTGSFCALCMCVCGRGGKCFCGAS